MSHFIATLTNDLIVQVSIVCDDHLVVGEVGVTQNLGVLEWILERAHKFELIL